MSDETLQIHSENTTPTQLHGSIHRPRRLSHTRRILLLAIMAGLPGTLIALILIWNGDFSSKVQWTLTLLIVMVWWVFTVALKQRVEYPLRTVSNILAALREGDYSLRARGAREDDALGEILLEVNALGQTLRQQRLGAMEAAMLLQKVMAEIDVAIFTFDSEQKLRFVNKRGERLLGQPAEKLLGCSSTDLQLKECLRGDASRTIESSFPGGHGQWGLRRSTFREGGLPHQLLVLSDLTRTLHQEERQAWQRLIQVLRHEINNSLAPIDSLAGSLLTLLCKDPRPDDWETDIREGLDVIADRSQALNRFMTAYSLQSQVVHPLLVAIKVGDWVRRVAGLDTRLKVQIVSGPPMTIEADGDQLDQVLINLVRNAVDAALETGGEVSVGWSKVEDGQPWLEVWVEDQGPGLSNTQNLFVPFFTTKPEGSGIGLALCRQIADAHGGRLTLENRQDSSGCRACLRLPLVQELQ